MTIKGRINKLEELAKPLVDKKERENKELEEKEKFFHILNQVMKGQYPEHEWNGLSTKDRHRIYFAEPKGTFDYTNPLFPRFIPDNKKESDLLAAACRLFANTISKELSRRRELKRGKIKNNYPR